MLQAKTDFSVEESENSVFVRTFMPANSLYVMAALPSPSETLEVVWPDNEECDETTAIEAPDAMNGQPTNDATYTLQGIRVNKTEKGRLYIRNGRKFVAE